MRTPIGEVFFIHPAPFARNYQQKSDAGRGSAVGFRQVTPQLFEVGSYRMIVYEGEPPNREQPSESPSEATRRHFESVGWPWAPKRS